MWRFDGWLGNRLEPTETCRGRLPKVRDNLSFRHEILRALRMYAEVEQEPGKELSADYPDYAEEKAFAKKHLSFLIPEICEICGWIFFVLPVIPLEPSIYLV